MPWQPHYLLYHTSCSTSFLFVSGLHAVILLLSPLAPNCICFTLLCFLNCSSTFNLLSCSFFVLNFSFSFFFPLPFCALASPCLPSVLRFLYFAFFVSFSLIHVLSSDCFPFTFYPALFLSICLFYFLSDSFPSLFIFFI